MENSSRRNKAEHAVEKLHVVLKTINALIITTGFFYSVGSKISKRVKRS